MFDKLNAYKNKGHFFFMEGSILKEVSKDVPELPGVYYIVRLRKGHIDVVYIGKSGTMNSNGTFSEQLLNKQLNNEQDGIKRQQFLDQKLEEEECDAFDIYWIVTFDNKKKDLPAYVEALLFQQYFNLYGRLPEWNKEF